MTLLKYNNKYQVTSTTQFQTSSTTMANDTPATLTFTLSKSQTVLIMYSLNKLCDSTTTAEHVAAINIDGTDYNPIYGGGGGQYAPSGDMVIWLGTLAAGQHTVNGRYACWGSTSTSTISNRTLMAYVFDGDEYLSSYNTTEVMTSSTTYTDDAYATFTFTPSAACVCLAMYNATNSVMNEDYRGRSIMLNIGGTDITASIVQGSPIRGTNHTENEVSIYAQSLPASQITIKGRYMSPGAAATYIDNHGMFILMMDPASCTLDIQISAANKTFTSASFISDPYATITRNFGGELLAFYSTTKLNGTTGSQNGNMTGISLDSVDVASQPSFPGGGVTARSESALVIYAATVGSASHTINGRLAENRVNGTACIDKRVLIALWFSSIATVSLGGTATGGAGTVADTLIAMVPLNAYESAGGGIALAPLTVSVEIDGMAISDAGVADGAITLFDINLNLAGTAPGGLGAVTAFMYIFQLILEWIGTATGGDGIATGAMITVPAIPSEIDGIAIGIDGIGMGTLTIPTPITGTAIGGMGIAGIHIIEEIPLTGNTNGGSGTTRAIEYISLIPINPFGTPFKVESDSVTIAKTIQDDYWKCDIDIEDYFPAQGMTIFTPISWPDHQDVSHQLFWGFCPMAEFTFDTAKNKTKFASFDNGYYLSVQPVPLSLLATDGVSDPSTIINALLGGVNWLTTTGVMPYHIDTVPNWGTSTLPARQWKWNDNTMKMKAIKDICSYCTMQLIVTWRMLNGAWTPVAYFIPAGSLDSEYDLLPSPVTFTNPDPYVLGGIKLQQRDSEVYNQIIVLGSDVNGNYYTNQDPTNGNAQQTQSPAVTNNAVCPIPYIEKSSKYNSQALVNARALVLWGLKSQPAYVYTADILERCDLQLYQKVQFIGYTDASGEVEIPSSWMRIIGIQYKLSAANVVVEIQCILDQLLHDESLLLNALPPDDFNNTQSQIDYALSQQQQPAIGTVQSTSGNTATVKLIDGTILQNVIVK